MSIRLASLLALAAACHAPSAPRPPSPEPAQAAPERARPYVGLTTSGGAHVSVRVEIAASAEARRVGLMNRRELGTDDGMLFVFERDQPLTFWMHDTLIPLDMIFVREDGTVQGIVENATPQTDTPRAVPGYSRYVLEVNGGWAAAHGVRAGDRVELSAALEALGTRVEP